MAEIPVEIISSGYTWMVVSNSALSFFYFLTYSSVWVDRTAVDVEIVFCQHFGALVYGSS